MIVYDREAILRRARRAVAAYKGLRAKLDKANRSPPPALHGLVDKIETAIKVDAVRPLPVILDQFDALFLLYVPRGRRMPIRRK
jgi:hypothetical protein